MPLLLQAVLQLSYMKIKIYKLFLLLSLSTIFAACTNDNDTVEQRSVSALNMQTQGLMKTAWATGDKIGLTIRKNSGGRTTYINNLALQSQAEGATAPFTPEGTTLSVPMSETTEITAYYPYQANSTTVQLNTSNQENPEAIDFLTAHISSHTWNASPSIVFKSLMAHVSITLRCPVNPTKAEQTDVYLRQIATQAAYNTTDGKLTGEPTNKKDLLMATGGASNNAYVHNAMVLPQTLAPFEVRLALPNGKDSIVTIMAQQRFESGRNYSFTIDIVERENANQSYSGWLEIPTISDAQRNSDNLRYVTHYFYENGRQVRNYSMLYDTNLKMAYWVAYPLCNFYTHVSAGGRTNGWTGGRTDDWNWDPSIPQTGQAMLFSGMSNGYDRGHQIPSADRQTNATANRQTFYFTNMTPQVGKGLNQDIWSSLEGAVRGWSSNVDTLYVVTGAMPTTPEYTTVNWTYDNNGKRIAIPKYYFKALCHLNRRTGQAKTIAFVLNNTKYSNNNYMNCAMSVAELEELTGFEFFPQIDEAFKQSYDAAQW